MGVWQTEKENVETISIGHVQVRKGNLFSADHLFTGIADTNSVEIIGITGSKKADLMVLVKSTGEAEIEFIKDPTFTDNGTEVPVVNRNATSSKTPITSIYHTPTIDSSGVIFSHGLIPGGSGKFTQIGGEAGTGAEYIVAPNSNYLLRVINTSGSESKILVEFIWHEHEA